MSTPNRRTRSHLNLDALVSTVTSIDDLSAALVEISTVIQAFDLPPLDLPAKLDVSSARIVETCKSVLPKLTVAVERLHKQGASVPALLQTLKGCISFLGSPEFQKEIITGVLASDAFKEAIDGQVAEKLRQMQEEGDIELPSPAPGRVVDLEDKCHWVVCKLIDKTFRKHPFAFTGSIDHFPPFDPALPAMQTSVQGSGGLMQVWRPDWADFEGSKPFVDAVVARFQAEFAGEYKDLDVIERTRRYFVWASTQVQKSDAVKAAEKKTRGASARSTAVAKAFKADFPTSLLNRCRERAFYNNALELGVLKIVQIAHDEAHGLPKAEEMAPDGSKFDFDGFSLLRDLWFESRGKDGDSWVCLDTAWWSPELALGVWTLYEEGNRPGKAKTPLFHLPAPYRPTLSLDELPTLAPPPLDTTDNATARSKKRPRISKSSKKALELTRGMIAPEVLLSDEYDAWRHDLRPDPVPAEADDDRPTLAELLALDENAELKRSVDKHLSIPPSVGVNELRTLGLIRSIGTGPQYLQALRATDEHGQSDASGFLRSFDATSLYLNNDQ